VANITKAACRKRMKEASIKMYFCTAASHLTHSQRMKLYEMASKVEEMGKKLFS